MSWLDQILGKVKQGVVDPFLGSPAGAVAQGQFDQVIPRAQNQIQQTTQQASQDYNQDPTQFAVNQMLGFAPRAGGNKFRSIDEIKEFFKSLMGGGVE